VSERILVIEDNQANLELMVYLLSAFGYDVLTALDGAEGLEKATCDLPELIVCDIQMPVIDGYEVVRRLKNDPDLSHIPVIAVTAFAMVGDRQKVMAAGFDDYCTKPIDPEEFLKQIAAFLRSGSAGH